MPDPGGIGPIYFFMPGTHRTADGAVFATSSYETDCGILLRRLSDGEELRIPFEECDRFGAYLRREVRLSAGEDYAYRFYRGEEVYTDPYAHALIEPDDGVPVPAGLLTAQKSPVSDGQVQTAAKALGDAAGVSLFYQLHVRGFTMAGGQDVPKPYRGTFEGVALRAPYLKSLGVDAVDLMPVYEAASDVKNKSGKGRRNYWGYGEGFYEAPRREYAAGDDPEASFAAMVQTLHSAGIRVFLQLHFPAGILFERIRSAMLRYMTDFQVDGFHLIGSETDIRPVLTDPVLAETILIHESAPEHVPVVRRQDSLLKQGKRQVRFYSMCGDTKSLIRRFIKGDAGLLREVTRRFIHAQKEFETISFAADHDGFTLADTVSYSFRHNEENGEENRDGTSENNSWNCGEEGPTNNREIRKLRRRQVRNFLTLVFLMRGVPLLYAGDECFNTQKGNNNAYCLDDPTGWTKLCRTGDAGKTLSFTRKLSAFRNELGLYADAKDRMPANEAGNELPALSLHGEKAYCPDFTAESRSIGIVFKTGADSSAYAVCLAINMHWRRQEIALPRIPAGWKWKVCFDTFSERSFYDEPVTVKEQQHLLVRERSIQILMALRDE